ncbi:MAG: tyrosine-type recombinase/integrase [Phenylobacterium sp.]|uniref:tyrosine-type recombinase/integrase n=1 Tax=Phenylobacterium sp. TaxID=1871053 RepID=UPI001A23FD6E|nr:tyrosine-type recombinase/integrase [Phenylobacterium sp.]MBJ7409983.1 tyrosine-type recombinase/integrase [Phenylobacterium sp.]
MPKANPLNEGAKHDYLVWLKDAQGRSDETLDAVAAAIDRFETHAGHRDFRTFRREQASSFKAHLAKVRNSKTGKPLSKATIVSTLNAVRAFFEWLAREPGYRSRIIVSDVAYFRPTAHDVRIATAKRDRPAPSLEQVQHVLANMPAETTVQRRDRAVVALILATGARDAAVASLPLKRLDLAHRRLDQDARDVKTKGRKTFSTGFYPVGDEAIAALEAWVRELKEDLLFGPDEPLFPATDIGLDDRGAFAPVGVTREFWTTASPIRAIFRKAFEAVGLPSHGPHSLRRMLTARAYDLNLGLRERKAWSQNLGHESEVTTFGSYGTLSAHEQGEVMRRLSEANVVASAPDVAAEIAELLRRRGVV